MQAVEEQDESLAEGSDVTSLNILLPAELREELGRVAKLNERSLGGECRAALRSWLAPPEGHDGPTPRDGTTVVPPEQGRS